GLAHARVHGHARSGDRVALDSKDLERALVERWRELNAEGLGRGQLAREPVTLADQVVAELQLVVDRARWRRALGDLDAAGRAAAATPAGRGDVDALRMRGAEQDATGLDGDRPAIRQNRHGNG